MEVNWLGVDLYHPRVHDGTCRNTPPGELIGAAVQRLRRSRGGAAWRNAVLHRRPQAEATRRNVTKPHRPRTYRDEGRERASGAAGRSTRQAGASTSRRRWLRLWTRMESRASSGLKEKYDIGAVMRTSDGRSNRRFVCNHRSRMSTHCNN